MQNKQLSLFEDTIGYRFRDGELLKQAFTHTSFANEMKINKQKSYERLEFLGDAVLEMISSKFLFNLYPEKTEGELSKIRASMVCEPSLAFCARDMHLEEYIRLGKGEEVTGGRNRDSIISDVLEAVIGALYLDGGFEIAEDFIHRYILSDIDDKRLFFDAKTLLQELVQKDRDGRELVYVLLDETGPDHDKEFVVQVKIGEMSYGIGKGKSKKSAEQQAAYLTLRSLKQEE